MEDTLPARDGNLRFTAMAGKHKGERNAKGEGRAGKPEAAKKQPRPQETSSGVLDFGFPGEGSPSAHTLAPPALRASRRGGVFGRPVTVGATTILPVVSRIRVGSAIRVDRPVGVVVIDRGGPTPMVP